MVIHDTGQVIEGKTIRLEDDSVIDVAILKSDISVNLVMHNSLALQRHSNAHHILEASRLVRRTLLFSQVTAMPVVTRRQLLCGLGNAHLLQSLRCTITTIGMTELDQLVSILLIDRLALCLIIGTILSTYDRPLVVIYTQPVHPIQENLDCPFNRPRDISILYTENECTTCMAGIEPAKENSAIPTDMHKTCRTWGKAQPWLTPSLLRWHLLKLIINLCHKCRIPLFLITKYFDLL